MTLGLPTMRLVVQVAMCRCVPWQGGETCLRCCAGLQGKREALAPYRKRFVKRIDRPEKNWKFSASDIADRTRWDELPADILGHPHPHEH
jgi:hypothetical protein